MLMSDEYSYFWVTSSLLSASPELLVCITNPCCPVGPLCSGPQTVLPFLPRVTEAQNTLLGHWIPSCLNPSHLVLCRVILLQLCLSILSSLPSSLA